MMHVWCLSVTYIKPKSRTERPRKTKIGTEVAYITHDSDTTFKVKGQLAGCGGILCRPSAQLASDVIRFCDAWVTVFVPMFSFVSQCKKLCHASGACHAVWSHISTGISGFCQHGPSITEWEVHITAQPPAHVSEVAYTVSSWTLNSTIPYHFASMLPHGFLWIVVSPALRQKLMAVT